MIEPVWLGWRDGLDYRQVSGEVMLGVTHWMDLPEPPNDKWKRMIS